MSVLGLIRRLIRHMIVLGYDVGVHLAEWPRVMFLRLNKYTDTITALEQGGIARLAIVAPHPTHLLEFSMRHLILGLLDNDYTVVVLMHDARKSKWLQDEFPQVYLAPRKKKGRDFGAWKEFIVAIYGSEKLLETMSKLILVNDSLFYNCGASKLIRDISAAEGAWACLYENFELHYHAQSFLLEFDSVVLKSKAFRNFWMRYRPYSSRRHSIDKGEVKLTHVVSQEFGPPTCLLRSQIFINRLLTANRDELRQMAIALNANPHLARTESLYLDEIFRLMGDLPFPNASFIQADEMPVAKIKDQLAMFIGDIIENHNPTHMVGLLANIFWETPIKRDISVRAHYRMSDILRTMRGYGPDEAKIIEYDLRAKKVVAPMKGIGRVLFDAGRI